MIAGGWQSKSKHLCQCHARTIDSGSRMGSPETHFGFEKETLKGLKCYVLQLGDVKCPGKSVT